MAGPRALPGGVARESCGEFWPTRRGRARQLSEAGGWARVNHSTAVDFDRLPATGPDRAREIVCAGRCAGPLVSDGPSASEGHRAALLRRTDGRRDCGGPESVAANRHARLEARESLAGTRAARLTSEGASQQRPKAHKVASDTHTSLGDACRGPHRTTTTSDSGTKHGFATAKPMEHDRTRATGPTNQYATKRALTYRTRTGIDMNNTTGCVRHVEMRDVDSGRRFGGDAWSTHAASAAPAAWSKRALVTSHACRTRAPGRYGRVGR